MCLHWFLNLKLTPILEWCMVGFEPKNIHQIDMCWKKIGPCTQNVLSITRGNLHDCLMTPKIMRKVAMCTIWIC